MTPSYVELAPQRELARWVECYWTIQADAASSLPNRVLPDGCADVIAGIGSDPRPVVVGTMATAAVYRLSGRVDLFGIRFRPGGAFPFLGVPLAELTDRRVPLDLVWGRGADLMSDALAPADPALRAARAGQVLRARLPAGAPRGLDDDALAARAVTLLRRTRGGIGVREAAAALGVGERRLERLFDRLVGIGPKALGRVLRFRHAVREIHSGEPRRRPGSWAALAGGAGYADQSHLIREFRALAGVTPAEYAAEQRAVGFVQYGSDTTA